MNSSDEDSSDHDIDHRNFDLGKGTWTEKKVRVDNFINKLADNQRMQKEFKLRRNYPKASRPIIQGFESAKTSIMENNKTLVPKYKDFTSVKRQFLQT